MSNCISGLISNMLRDYVEPLEGNQVSISIWNGNAELRNLTLKSTALFNAGAPLGVTKGTIDNLKIHYPWGFRDVQPTSIKIAGINIEAYLIEDVKFKRIQNRKKESEKDHQSNKDDKEPHNTSFLGRFFSSISDNVNKKIVSNLIVEINHFNFQVHMTTENLKEEVLITMHFNDLRLNMQNENSYFAIDGLLFSINSEKPENNDTRSKMKFEMKAITADTNKTTSDILLNSPFFQLDINAFCVADVFVTVQNSPWYKKNGHQEKPSETEKEEEKEKKSENTFLTKYKFNGMKANIYDKNIDFNVDIDGNCNMCGLKRSLEVTKFDVYICEDNHQYPYIFHDMTVLIEKDDIDFYVTFNNFIISLSYSDMIDLSNFYNKREKMLAFYNEKIKDENDEEEDKSDEKDEEQSKDKKKHHHHHHKKHFKKHHGKKGKNKKDGKSSIGDEDDDETEENYYVDNEQNNVEKNIWHLKPFEFLMIIYENNRTTNILYPFFRIVSHVPELKVIFDKESIFPIPEFECDIFNKKTQKWDVLMEPLSMIVHMKEKNSYKAVFANPINLNCSLQSMIQINQFSYKRLKYDSKENHPHYFIENNTNEACTIKCNKKNVLTIDPYQTKEFVYTEPFEIKKVKIDPINFFSPSFITNNVAVSVFSKGKKKIISVNYAIQIKNKSSLKLYYQNSKNEVTEIRPNGFTALINYSPKFLINGTEEVNIDEMIAIDSMKEEKKTLIKVSNNDTTYNMLFSYKFSKKKGIFMLLIRPHYKIVNELSVPIKFTVPKTNESLELNKQSAGFVNDIGQEENLQCTIEMNDTKSEEININVKDQQLIPVKFPKINRLLSIFYNDYIIIIKPPMTLKNQTPFPITVYDGNNQLAVEAKADEDDVPFGTNEYFNPGQINISFKISKYKKTEPIKLQDGRTELLLKSETKPNISYPVVFANYLGANGVFHLFVFSLIKIKNKTKKQINVFPIDQTNKQCDESISVKPGEISPITSVSKTLNFSVSFEKSTKAHIVSFKFNSNNDVIEEDNSKIEIQTRLKFSNASYYVIFHEIDDKDEIKKQNDDKQSETFSLSVQIPRFAVIVLDEKMREMFNFALNRISYNYDPGNEEEVFNGTIDDFQIDDLCPSTKIKNVLYTTSHPFVTARIHKNDAINTCDVQINHVVFNFDFNFVSNVLTEMMKMYRGEPDDENKKEEKEEEEEEEEENKNVEYYSLHSNEKIDYYVAPENGYVITVQQMNIKPFSFGINFTQNLRPTYHDFEFGSIPYLNETYNFAFNFNQFTMSNMNATIDELMNIFYDSYYSGFILSFFNSLPLNPSNILEQFNELKSKGGVATIDFNKIQYDDMFSSFHKQLTYKIGSQKDGNKKQTVNWMRSPRSINNGNQIVPFDEDVSICQFKFQQEINNFDEYFTLFVKNDKNIYCFSQFHFVEFHKKIVNSQSHFKLAKNQKLSQIKSIDISGKTLTLNFYDSTNEKINCDNTEIANNAYHVISNRLHTRIE